MQLKPALLSAVEHLTAEKVPSPRMNAELLLMFSLVRDRAFVYAHPEYELTVDEADRYQAALSERCRGVPAQYITGHQEFWGLDVIVTPAVLIPRPETEHLVETVRELINNAAASKERLRGKPRMIDVGTGSGCIALALAKEFPEAEIHATDISAVALEIAQANSSRHQFALHIHFHQADLLDGFEDNSFDLVVSNPPYVGESEEDQVQLEVRKFEPRNAVFAGPLGTEVIARLVPQALTVLKPGGWLVMEVSGTIVEGVKLLLNGWEEVRIVNDLQSIPRVIAAQKSRVM